MSGSDKGVRLLAERATGVRFSGGGGSKNERKGGAVARGLSVKGGLPRWAVSVHRWDLLSSGGVWAVCVAGRGKKKREGTCKKARDQPNGQQAKVKRRSGEEGRRKLHEPHFLSNSNKKGQKKPRKVGRGARRSPTHFKGLGNR